MTVCLVMGICLLGAAGPIGVIIMMIGILIQRHHTNGIRARHQARVEALQRRRDLERHRAARWFAS